MKLTNYEIIGMAASIAIMSVALWLLNISTSSPLAAQNNAAAVLVGGNDQAALADALTEAGADSEGVDRLVIDDVAIGTGAEAADGRTVTVNYIGTLTNGTQFANTYKTGQPLELVLKEGRVIEGWRRGLEGMKVGGQRVLVVPPELGYGNAGGGPIPANATLVFAVELVSVE